MKESMKEKIEGGLVVPEDIAEQLLLSWQKGLVSKVNFCFTLPRKNGKTEFMRLLGEREIARGIRGKDGKLRE